MSRLAPLLALAALLLVACGGSDSSPGGGGPTGTTTSATPAPDPEARRSATAYARTMEPIATDLVRVLRGLDLARNRADFDRGVALLRGRKRMARVTADPGLLLAHDRLAKAVSAGGTMLVAEPQSEYARSARRAGTPIGTRSAVLVVGRELGAWAVETEQQLRDAGVEIPAWLKRAERVARALSTRAAERLD